MLISPTPSPGSKNYKAIKIRKFSFYNWPRRLIHSSATTNNNRNNKQNEELNPYDLIKDTSSDGDIDSSANVVVDSSNWDEFGDSNNKHEDKLHLDSWCPD